MALPVGAFTALSAMMVAGYTLAFLYCGTLLSQITFRMVSNPNDHFWEVKSRDCKNNAILNNPKLGTHGFIQVKDVKIHYVENGDKSKPLMLFIHGYPEFWFGWRNQLEEFSKDYWVVAIDMRGFGESDKPEGAENYKADIIVEDIRQVVAKLGKQKFILVGHDWGGIIAWYFVLTHPELVSCYIMMNAGHPIVLQEKMNTNLEQIKKSWYGFFYQFPYLPELRATMDDMVFLNTSLASSKVPSAMTHDILEVYKCNYGKPGAFTAAMNIYRANIYLETSHKLLEKGKAANFPHGLCLFGNEDKILDLLQKDSVNIVKNAHLIYINGAGHFVQWDDPTAVNREMRTFLSQQKL